MDKIIKFDFDSWSMPLSHKIIMYICPKCKYKIEVPVEVFKNGKKKICGMEKINLYHHMVNVKIVTIKNSTNRLYWYKRISLYL